MSMSLIYDDSHQGIYFMNIFEKLAVTGLALSVSSFASAAISGSTDFRVVLPEVLVLYHWDDAVLTLTDVATTAANDSDAREISDATTRTGTVELGTATASINTDVDTTSNTALATNIAVTLKNAWAVRNLSSATGVTLALTNPNTDLLNVGDNNSIITTSLPTLASTNAAVSAGSGTDTVTIDSGFAAVLGDINFNLDLSTANRAGEYNTRGATGPADDTATGNGTDTFLLTLTGN